MTFHTRSVDLPYLILTAGILPVFLPVEWLIEWYAIVDQYVTSSLGLLLLVDHHECNVGVVRAQCCSHVCVGRVLGVNARLGFSVRKPQLRNRW